MSLLTLFEVARKLLLSPLVLDIDVLGTKVRAHLPKGYTLDIYFNATLQKYSYTVIKRNKRIIGWDNAPHHKQVKTYPHHFHTRDGQITQSLMKGKPIEDIPLILKELKGTLKL
jgi:hypothetical protein